MKGITKDCLSLQYERSIKKNFALHLRPYIPIPQYWPGVSCIYDTLAAFKLSYDISPIKSPAFTSTFTILCSDIIFICTCNIYSLKIFKEGKIYEVDIKAIQNFFVIFFVVFTLNGMGGVLCSAIASELLKMRKSLAIHY